MSTGECLSETVRFSPSVNQDHDQSSSSEPTDHQKPYHCAICNKTFSFAISLKRHQLIFHPGRIELHAKNEDIGLHCSSLQRSSVPLFQTCTNSIHLLSTNGDILKNVDN